MPPKGYVERMLGQNERILLTTRQHWFVVFRAILLEMVVIVLAIIAAGAAATSLVPLIGPFALLVAAVVMLLIIFPIITLVYDVINWYNRQYLVTTRRVMQVSGIFNKNVIDSSLEKVNDVKLSQSVFGRVFGYGDVEILTASELGVNLFRRIEDPIRFKTAMLNAKEQLERGSESGVIQPAQDIPAMIARLGELREKGVLTDEEFQKKKAELLAKL